MSKKKEFFNKFNTLSCIPQLLINEHTIIFMRNECWVAGKVKEADGFMNVTLDNAVYCNQKGNQYKMDELMIRFRQILYIQIPNKLDVSKSITDYLREMHKPQKVVNKKNTFKAKRALTKNQKTVDEILNIS